MDRREFLRRAGAGAGVVLSGCGSRRPRVSGMPPSVVMVVMDTVRARSCSTWGFGRNTTPSLSALAEHATRYRHAIATAPWTLPSHASIFTGEYTCQHGTRGYPYQDDSGTLRMRETILPESKETLSERLLQAGYATAMFSANDGYLAPYFNLDQGFETYHARFEPGLDLIERALHWLDESPRRPFFLFCNLMDAHSPYNLEPCPGLPEAVSEDTSLLGAFREQTLQNNAPLDQRLAAAVSAQYERGVANADRALGALMKALQQRELYDDIVFIATSDHGEYLGEHMLVEHSKDVYEEALHVPLLVKVPGQKRPATDEATSSLVQLPSTVLSLAGLERPAGFPPCLGDDAGTFPVLAENYFSRDWDVKDPRWKGRFERIRTASYNGDWKFILSSDGAHELYHLPSDPGEATNRASSDTSIMEGMRAACLRSLETFRRKAGVPEEMTPPLPLPPSEDQEALRALGYL